MAKKKIEDQDKVFGIYGFVIDNANKTASSIEKIVNNSRLDAGGIIIIHGPERSGKSIVICELLERIDKDKNRIKHRKIGAYVPSVDRDDIMKGWVFSRSGKKCKVGELGNKKEIEKMFNENDVVIVDDFQFIPYELQSFFVRELGMFVNRGGWFVGVGLLYNSQRGEFLISGLLLERAYREFNLCSLCQMCGAKAYKYCQRLINGKVAGINEPEILPPSTAVSYEPRCDNCHIIKV